MSENSTKASSWIWIVFVLVAAMVGFAAGKATSKPSRSGSDETLSEQGQGLDEMDERDARTGNPTGCEAVQQKCSKEIAELKNRLLGVQMMAASRSNQTSDGYDPAEVGEDVPVKWPEDTPEAFKEEEFTRIFKDAIAESGLDAELVRVDCEEAPCMAILRSDDELDVRKLTTTGAWKEKYDGTIGLRAVPVDCGDGRTENVAVIGKRWKDWEEKTQFHVSKRHLPRTIELVENWKCREQSAGSRSGRTLE